MATISTTTLAEFAGDQRTIEVDLGLPETLTVTYRAKTLTLNDQMQLQRFGGLTVLIDADVNWITSLAQRLILSWGITGPLTGADGGVIEPGAVVPIERQYLIVIGAARLFTIIGACLTDTAAAPKASMPADGSSTTGN